MKIEFIDYDGGFPNLCSGRLKFKADGKVYEEDVSLISGGSVWFDSHWCEHVEEGPWLDICDFYLFETYPELKQYKTELLKMINENVPHGCCGGCA